MSKLECPRVSLVEALRDGRLGPQERASMDRHVAVCAACASFARDLDRIGEAVRAPVPPLTPLEHQRARLGLLRRATEPQPADVAPVPRAPFVWARLAAPALLALAVVVGWIGGRATTSTGASAMLAFHLPRPPRLAPPRETTLRPSDDARFERGRTAGLDVVTLTTGALDVTVRPLAQGERFVVRTGDAEVEVHGTAVRVEADRGRIRNVAVAEGSVEVRYAGFTAVIPSGGSWRATAAPMEPSLAAPEPASPAPPPAAAPPPEASPPPPAAPPPLLVARAAPFFAKTAPAARRMGLPSPRASRSHPSPRPLIHDAPRTIAAEPLHPDIQRASLETPVLSAASRDFAGAMRALRLGDYDASAAQLAAFSVSYPGDARADEADYLRAIALQRAGRAPDATATARRYLATRPTGAHRAEARQIAGDF